MRCIRTPCDHTVIGRGRFDARRSGLVAHVQPGEALIELIHATRVRFS